MIDLVSSSYLRSCFINLCNFSFSIIFLLYICHLSPCVFVSYRFRLAFKTALNRDVSLLHYLYSTTRYISPYPLSLLPHPSVFCNRRLRREELCRTQERAPSGFVFRLFRSKDRSSLPFVSFGDRARDRVRFHEIGRVQS